MALYKYLRKAWKNPNPEVWKDRLIKWRREPSISRIEYPTRLDRARALGYKAKQGIILVRQRIPRGGRMRPKPSGGRRSAKSSRRLDLDLSYQTIAERRVARKYSNCEVLNSYYVAKDGRYYWYEVILIDRAHPVIKNDSKLSAISQKRGRVFRGLTSSARKSRGLRRKGKGAEKIR